MSACKELAFYWKEIKVSVLLGILVGFSFFRLIYSYNIVLITRDIEDEDEVRVSRIVILASAIS